ncbi:MAG: YhcH/YjgK/YiaL family protein [Rikenellaceae bacterium]
MKTFTIFITMVVACIVTTTTNLSAQTKESKAWYDAQEWLMGGALKPSTPSIDIDTFAKHYAQYPERWKVVFEYLATQDLKSVALGVTQLSDDVRVIVQEYLTRPTVGEKVLLERHEKFIDVQCMIEGEELHGASKLGNGELTIPYKESDDIMFYTVEDVPFYIIKAGYFTIFFPDDMHTTNYGFGERTNARKLVFKVRY